MIDSYLDGITQELLVNPVISSFKILRQEAGEDDGYVRIKCTIFNSDILEFAEYLHIRKKRVCNETYSFHWQTAEGQLVKRWDNVQHHREIDSFPHHIHLPGRKIIGSTPMTLKKVLAEIEKTISQIFN
ncbi:MAG: hypothetical protein HY807_01255 [Nitrospirae bacterium]|nr:hypothetical protein [Nitrospirota bacterium]